MNMAMLMENVDSESGSQNRLPGLDVEDSTHEKGGTMVTLERPEIPGEAHRSGCLYHNRIVSITTYASNKMTDHESLNGASLGVKMILIVDGSASTSLHQDESI